MYLKIPLDHMISMTTRHHSYHVEWVEDGNRLSADFPTASHICKRFSINPYQLKILIGQIEKHWSDVPNLKVTQTSTPFKSKVAEPFYCPTCKVELLHNSRLSHLRSNYHNRKYLKEIEDPKLA